MSRAALALGAAVLAGCTCVGARSDLDAFRCELPASTCPTGRLCVEVQPQQFFCVRPVAGAGMDATTEPDARTDAGPDSATGGDAGCTCDDGNACNGIATCAANGHRLRRRRGCLYGDLHGRIPLPGAVCFGARSARVQPHLRRGPADVVRRRSLRL
jgi:hypothetical protein